MAAEAWALGAESAVPGRGPGAAAQGSLEESAGGGRAAGAGRGVAGVQLGGQLAGHEQEEFVVFFEGFGVAGVEVEIVVEGLGVAGIVVHEVEVVGEGAAGVDVAIGGCGGGDEGCGKREGESELHDYVFG